MALKVVLDPYGHPIIDNFWSGVLPMIGVGEVREISGGRSTWG